MFANIKKMPNKMFTNIQFNEILVFANIIFEFKKQKLHDILTLT